MRAATELLFVAMVWLPPLLIAILACLYLRRAMSYLARLSIWAGYVACAVGWIWLWNMEARRTRELSAEEVVFVAGFWVTPVIGALLMLGTELARVTKRRPPGFDVVPVNGVDHGENRDPG